MLKMKGAQTVAKLALWGRDGTDDADLRRRTFDEVAELEGGLKSMLGSTANAERLYPEVRKDRDKMREVFRGEGGYI